MNHLAAILIWLCFAVAGWPTMFPGEWECLLVLFVALVLRPLAFGILGEKIPRGFLEDQFFPVLLGLAYLNSEKNWAAFAAAGYAFWALWRLLSRLSRLLTAHFGGSEKGRPFFSLDTLLPLFALGYWLTGAVFSFFYIADFQPLGFDPIITSLTAAHFHMAGFVLTTLIFALWKHRRDGFSKTLALAALVGMPAVAAGITATKFGFPPTLETASAVLFAGIAFGVAALQIRMFFFGEYQRPSRWLWLASALCLVAGATLAVLYGLRFRMPLEWVNIPNLKLWHGTLNTIGFGWFGLLAWRFYSKVPFRFIL